MSGEIDKVTATILLTIVAIIGLIIFAVSNFDNHIDNQDVYTIQLAEIENGIYGYTENVVSSIPAQNYTMATFCGIDGTVCTVKGYAKIINQDTEKPYAVWEYTHIVNKDTVTFYCPLQSVKFNGTISTGEEIIMAALDGEITISAERRPCIVDGRKAMFHRWADTPMMIQHSPDWKFELERRCVIFGESFEEKDTECIQCTMAIVEYEDGTVDTVYPHKIRFVGNEGFNEIEWPDSAERKEHG